MSAVSATLPSTVVLLALGAALVGACATTGSVSTRHCTGDDLQLDAVLQRCIVEELRDTQRIAPVSALQMQVSLRPPPETGGDVSVLTSVTNVTDAPVRVDIVVQEFEPDPHPLLLGPRGFRIGNDLDPSCSAWTQGGVVGGLGASPAGERAIARVELAAGGTISAERSLPARKGLCTCSADDKGVLDMRCTDGAGGPAPAGTWTVSVSMPLAVSGSGGGRYTFPSAKAPIVLEAAGAPEGADP